MPAAPFLASVISLISICSPGTRPTQTLWLTKSDARGRRFEKRWSASKARASRSRRSRRRHQAPTSSFTRFVMTSTCTAPVCLPIPEEQYAGRVFETLTTGSTGIEISLIAGDCLLYWSSAIRRGYRTGCMVQTSIPECAARSGWCR